MSHELTGARALGMRAIWFDDDGSGSVDRPHADLGWDGEQIADLGQLPGLLTR